MNKNSAIARNIYAIRNHFGYTQESFAKLIGVSQVTVSKWETSGHRISEENIEAITSALPISYDSVVGDTNGYASLLEDFGTGVTLQNAQPVAGADMVAVPLRGRVHAGPATEPEDLGELGKTVLIPRALLDADPDTYACESEGDCMDKVYPEGCTVVVSPNRQPQNGSVAVVTIDGHDAVMRRMYRTPNTLVLSPDSHNPEHTDIVITSDSDHTVEFGGKVVWFQAREEME